MFTTSTHTAPLDPFTVFIPGVGHVGADTQWGLTQPWGAALLPRAWTRGHCPEWDESERQNSSPHYVWSLEKPNARKQRGEGGGCQELRAVGGDRDVGVRGLVQLEDEWLLGSDVQCGTVVNSAELCAWKLLGAWVLSVSNSLPKGETQSDSEVIHVSVNLTVVTVSLCAYWIILLDTLICSILLVSNTAGKN